MGLEKAGKTCHGADIVGPVLWQAAGAKTLLEEVQKTSLGLLQSGNITSLPSVHQREELLMLVTLVASVLRMSASADDLNCTAILVAAGERTQGQKKA